MLLTQLRRAVVLAVIAFVFVFVYALVGTGLSQLLFKDQASGSITANGSTMIGQSWSGTKWFHGRPDSDDPLSANGTAGESGATNLGPRSKTLVVDTRKLIEAWHKVGVNPTSDLVTTSGSGLDPDISPEAALFQVPRVAKARSLPEEAVRQLVVANTQGRLAGILGEPRVNVLALNLAVDRAASK